MPERESPAAPENCANCGADIPRGAKACPECGADERTGWRETSIYDGLDLPEESFEPEEKGRRPRPASVNSIPWYWWCVGVAVLLLFALGALGLR